MHRQGVAGSHVRPMLEQLEPRLLLDGVAIPTLIDPDLAEQVVFAPGVSQRDIPDDVGGPDSLLLKFALDGPAFSDTTLFKLFPGTPTGGIDAALALYDGDGNLLASADFGDEEGDAATEALSAEIESGRAYVLGAYFDPAGPTVDFVLQVTTAPQVTNTPIAIDPATGLAQLEANTGEDTFNTPADVDYYELDLLNGGSDGTVAVTPTGLDVQVFAALYRQALPDLPWELIAADSDPGGGPVTLALTPESGHSLTDSEYVLAVAPVGFDTAARSYRIEVAASSLLVPTTVDPVSATDLGTPPPVSPGYAAIAHRGELPVGTGELFRVLAVGGEETTLSLGAVSEGPYPPPPFEPVLSVYDETGADLLAVVSSTSLADPSVSVALPASIQPGEAYLLQVSDVGDDRGGTYDLTVNAEYEPQDLPLSGAVTQVDDVPISADQVATFYRFQPDPGTDVLVVGLAPGPAAGAKVVLVGGNLPAMSAEVSAGEALRLALDLRGTYAPYDLYVAGTSAAAAATLRVGQVDVPTELDPAQLASSKLDLSGDLTWSQPAGGFGDIAGATYYQLLTDPAADPAVLSAEGSAGGALVLAHYGEQGGQLRLAEYVLSDAAGLAEMQKRPDSRQFHGLAAFDLSLDPAGDVTVGLAGPDPIFVGVGMVPDLEDPPPPPYRFILSIRDVVLETEFTEHLWKTILPFNILDAGSVSLVSFDPATAEMKATITVYVGDTAGPPINVAVVSAQNPTFLLNETVENLRGRSVYFRVEPVAGRLGDGQYTLEMTVNTTDPHPYELTENAWKFYGTSPAIPQGDQPAGELPAGTTVVDIVQNQFGDGSAVGTFADPVLGVPLVHVYRFWAVTPGPLTVRTVPVDPFVNTTLRVYQARFNAGQISYLGRVPDDDPGLGDWFGANRDQIDDQSHFQNPDVLSYAVADDQYGTGGGMYYVVVKNEQGTQGQYRVEVDATPFPRLGGVDPGGYDDARAAETAYIPCDTGGDVGLAMKYMQAFTEFVGYFPVQVPDHHDGTLYLSSSFSYWDYDVFDAAGEALNGLVWDTGLGTDGLFAVPGGGQALALRVKEQTQNLNGPSIVSVSAYLQDPLPPPGPPGLPMSRPPHILPTSPLGDGGLTEELTDQGRWHSFGFRAAPGLLTVDVAPDDPADLQLRWGVFVDGLLRAWEITTATPSDGSTTTMLALPTLRPPLVQPDYDYDKPPATGGNFFHDVIVYVEALNTPAGDGTYSVSVESDAPLPMRGTVDLVLGPLGYVLQDSTTVNGFEWTRLIVPHGTTSVVHMHVEPDAFDPGGTEIRYDLYDAAGNFLSTGTDTTDLESPDGVEFNLLGAYGGGHYYLRTGVVGDVQANVVAEVLANAPKGDFFNGYRKPSAGPLFLLDDHSVRLCFPPPDGQELIGVPNGFDPLHPELIFNLVFWINRGGVATFDADLADSDNPYIAIHRARKDFPGEQPQYMLDLVDYANTANIENGRYHLSTYLEPGTYTIRGIRGSGVQMVWLEMDLPDYHGETVVLEPNSGDSSRVSLLGNETGRDGFGVPKEDYRLLEAYRTSVYNVQAPAGTQNGMAAVAFNLPDDATGGWEDGLASMAVHRQPVPGGAYISYFPPQVIDPPGSPAIAWSLPAGVEVEPFDPFWICIHRDFLSTRIGAGFEFVVPESGKPDLVVDPIVLSPNNGETRVDVEIRNAGYGSASMFHSLYQYSDTSKQPTTYTTAELMEMPMGPLGGRHRALAWTPQRPQDEVTYHADHDEQIEEIDEANNAQSVAISTVDLHQPVLTIILSDPTMDGNPDPNIYGRYISGVAGPKSDVIITTSDGDGPEDFYKITGWYPPFNPPVQDTMGSYLVHFGPDPETKIRNFSFGALFPTMSTNPNEFRMIARDQWGLPSEEVVKQVQVMPYPGWLLPNDGTHLSFDAASRRYQMHFRNSLIDVGPVTVDDLAGVTIPFIGDLNNRLLAEVLADGTASLDPGQGVSAAVTARARITIMGMDIINETYTGSGSGTDHFEISAQLFINSLSLDTDFLAITFRLIDLPLFDWQSPEIPLFAYGVPGVASINANLQFVLNATLDAAVTIALDQNVPLEWPSEVGLASPSFIAPTISAGLEIAGEVEILGFDLAELSGTIWFALTPAFGLTTQPNVFVPVDEFFSNSCLEVTGELYGEVAAEILGIEIYSFDLPSVEIPFPGSCNVVRGALGGGEGDEPFDGTLTIPGGNEPAGSLRPAPSPNIVIDPTTGEAMFVQVVDVDPALDVYKGNLAYSRRVASVWSALATLDEPGTHVSNPVLALTRDDTDVPCVVVYQSMAAAGDPADRTRNEFLTAQDIHWRYFDGQAWEPAHSLTNDALYDADPAVAFNDSGRGVAAWVHNTNASPLSDAGAFDRSANEIQVAVWDPGAHGFGPPTTLTADAVGDGKPAAYAAPDGTLYVVWVQDTAVDEGSGAVIANQIMCSSFDGVTWSNPQALAINGLPADGKIGSVAIGSEGADRIDVLLTHTQTLPDKTVESRLYNRPSTAADFAAPAALELVADDANFSQLRTLQAPDGALVAYWQQGDGATNEVFASRIGPAGSGSATWSEPARLTAGRDLEFSPSVAVDTDGTYQVVYEPRTAPAGVPDIPHLTGHPDGDPPVGVPFAGGVGTSSRQPLPELSFSREFAFTDLSAAASGTEVEATAQIVNRGLGSDHVVIEIFRDTGGGPEALELWTIFMAPGSTYEITQAIVAVPGEATYGVQLTAIGGVEAVGDGDNVSTATLTGAPDLTISSVVLADPGVSAGETVDVVVTVHNPSDQTIGPFDVQLYEGNPAFEHAPSTRVGTAHLGGIWAGQSRQLVFPWTVPVDGGAFDLTGLADPDDAIAEATELNNDGHAIVVFRPDAALLAPPVATVLDYSGVDNVQVDAEVVNQGKVELRNVPVRLLWSLDDGDYEEAGITVIPSLAAGGTVPVSWVADGLVGLTGENRYRVEVDTPTDADPTNNAAQTLLILQGLPNLTVSDVWLSTNDPGKNEPLVVFATIENTGIATAQNVRVEIFAGSPDVGKRLVGQMVLASLGPLRDVSLDIPIDTSWLYGVTHLCVVVDRLEKILEVSDLDNEDCLQVTFADRLPPQVEATLPAGVHAGTAITPLTDQICVTFSEPMDEERAGNSGNYKLLGPGENGILGDGDDILYPLRAYYEAGEKDVILRIVSVDLSPGYHRLAINGHGGLQDLAGYDLDGDGDHVPGGDYVRIFVVVHWGDANGDGIVDGLDYVLWSNNYHQSGGWGDGDFTGDGYVDGLDYVVWSNNYKAVVPGGGSLGKVGDAAEQEVAATDAAQLPETEPVGEAGRGAIGRSSEAPIGPGVSAEWVGRAAGLGGWAGHAGGAPSESDMAGGKEDGRDVPVWPASESSELAVSLPAGGGWAVSAVPLNRDRAAAPAEIHDEVEAALPMDTGAAGRHSPARGLAALEDDLVDILGLVQLKAPLHA